MSLRSRYSDEELLEIAKKHKDFFTSVGKWNTYAKEHGLPHHQTFIQRFGSWNNIKDLLNFETNEQHRPYKYEVSELLEILNEHKEAYTGIYAWNQYAKEHQLPTHGVFERILGIKKLDSITNYTQSASKEDLKKIILSYFPNKPPTVNEWKSISKANEVPSFTTVIRRFGSWNLMKVYVYYR